jgi:hypothetical protein
VIDLNRAMMEVMLDCLTDNGGVCRQEFLNRKNSGNRVNRGKPPKTANYSKRKLARRMTAGAAR